jgi:hypothetical protein
VSTRETIKRIVQRKRLDRVLDWGRFRIDTFPRRGPLAKLAYVSYQPLPWVGIDGGRRAEGSRTRWRAISEVLDRLEDVRTGMDIGANAGYFVVCLADRGIQTVAVESAPVAYRTALYVISRSGVEGACVMTLEVGPRNVDLLPSVDAVICLSVWHHIVRAHGLEGATDVLRGIWAHTRRVLFFDTGENEITREWGLPRMEPDAATWLTEYLSRTCEGSTIEHLGVHQAFDTDLLPAERNLFAVIRAPFA